MRNFINITDIEDAFVEMVAKCNISSTIYENRPKSKDTANDFVVVSINDEVIDHDAYATTTIEVDLFAKDVENQKNGKRLRYMYNQLIDNLPMSYNVMDASFQAESFGEQFTTGQPTFGIMIDKHPTQLGDTPDDYGFHARMIQFKLIIKTI